MTQVDLDDSMFGEHTEVSFMDNNEISSFTTRSSNRRFKYPHALEDDDEKKESFYNEEDEDEEVVTIRSTPTKNNQSISNKKKKMPEKNPNFVDVEETGKWGSISRNEIICVTCAIIAVLVGVIVTTVVLIGRNNDDGTTVAPPPDNSNIEIDVLYYTEKQHYEGLINAIKEHPVVADTVLENFTADIEELNPIDVYTKAASWIIYNDPFPVRREKDLKSRFVLAVTYYTHNGDNWFNTENWLTSKNVCDWYGILCNTNNKQIIEIDLSNNNLTGILHEAWPLLIECESILLDSNTITGEITGTAFGNMEKLTYLYLQFNQLTGTIPTSLIDNGSLDTFYIQGNPVSGSWPEQFCPNFKEFGLNCEQLQCSCCNPLTHCFED